MHQHSGRSSICAEHLAWNQEAEGSNPSAQTKCGVAERLNVPALQAGGRRLNPGWLHHFNAAVAQPVERRPEKPGVEGSIPSRCTNSFARWQVAPERHPLTSASRTCRANRNRRPSASRGSMTPETRIWPRAESLDCRDRDPPGRPQQCGPPHPATLRNVDRHGEAQSGAVTGRGFGVYRTPSCETFQCRPEHLGVAVAQLAELRDVTPAVVGSNPTGHPQVFCEFQIKLR